MKAKFIINGEGPNPYFAPPDRNQDPAAYALYLAQTPHTVRIPVGTVVGVGCAIGNGDCWMLCCPDGSGDRKKNVPGLIHCVPADEECQIMVDAHRRSIGPDNRRWFDMALKRSAVVLKQQQDEEAKAKAAGEPLMLVHPDLVEQPAEAPAA